MCTHACTTAPTNTQKSIKKMDLSGTHQTVNMHAPTSTEFYLAHRRSNFVKIETEL